MPVPYITLHKVKTRTCDLTHCKRFTLDKRKAQPFGRALVDDIGLEPVT